MTESNQNYLDAALKGEVLRASNAQPSQRNKALFSSTAALGGLVHAGLREQIIRDRMVEAAKKNGLVQADGMKGVLKTIESGLRTGLNNPRNIAGRDGGPDPRPVESHRIGRSAVPPVGLAVPTAHPAWTASEGGEQPSHIVGKQEPPSLTGEIERYAYFQAGEPIRVKIKTMRAGQKGYSNWYKVSGVDGEVGWQARKPADFQEVPFIGVLDPFDAARIGDSLYWPEGEKDAVSLTKMDIPALTFGGTSDLPGGCEQYVENRDVVICADNDDTGREHAERKAWLCSSVAKSIRVLHFNDTKSGGDVSDWLSEGHTAMDLRALVDGTPLWQPTTVSGISETASVGEKWEEPDWAILDGRRGLLPPFPVHALPTGLREWLVRSAHSAGVTPDHVVVPLLAVASSLIGTARRIMPSPGWSEPCSLWTAVLGYSGTGKTPGLSVTKRALASIEYDRKDRVEELQRAHATKVMVAEVAEAAWKQNVKEAIAIGDIPPPQPMDAVDPGEFVAPRLFVSNATIERMAVLLQSSPRGMLVIADELAALFLNMSRYSNGQDNEFWLEAWNGEGYVVERMNRRLVIDHLLIGITGGFQPDKLSQSMKGAQDGMYARICFGWPAEPKYRPLSDEASEIEPEIVQAFIKLIDLPSSGFGEFAPSYARLSRPAREQFEQFRQFLHMGKTGLEGRDREWWAKGASHVLRLAGTLTFLEWSWSDGREPSEVEARHVESAILIWKEYFLPHSLAAVRCIGIGEAHSDERMVLNWIAANRNPEVSVQDVRRDALRQRMNAAETEALLDRLVIAGYLRAPIKMDGVGRPARRWTVNPKFLTRDRAGIAENAGIRLVT